MTFRSTEESMCLVDYHLYTTLFELTAFITVESTSIPRTRSVIIHCYALKRNSFIFQTTTTLWKSEDAIGNKASVDMPTHHWNFHPLLMVRELVYMYHTSLHCTIYTSAHLQAYPQYYRHVYKLDDWLLNSRSISSNSACEYLTHCSYTLSNPFYQQIVLSVFVHPI